MSPVRANENIPPFEQSDRVTGHCSAAVRGKRFVRPSAAPPGGMLGTENVRIAESAAPGANTIGVSPYDAALDEEVAMFNANQWVELTVGLAVTAGQALESDAQGRAVPFGTAAGGRILAVAVDDQPTVDASVVARLCL